MAIIKGRFYKGNRRVYFMEKTNQKMAKTGDENPVNRTSTKCVVCGDVPFNEQSDFCSKECIEKNEERERIKQLLKKHWNVAHPAYPSKLSYLFALIDEKQEEEDN